MIVLGVDPGVAATGYALVSGEGRALQALACGTIRVKTDLGLAACLAAVYEKIRDICHAWHPDCLALEEIFFSRNATSAMAVGHVRGAVILAATHAGLQVFAYNPLVVKQAVTGYGRAPKAQVKEMVRLILKLPRVPCSEHAADAFAVALCHFFRAGTRLAREGGPR